ncbi:peptidase C65 Otubain-domain-containing protein [Lipomyces tetrasporus]|uniref:ubiquitinyl hydrolase 1 n=1 Tax=Lipomyces tetrasporus TaxID=54092 RepID=A0AAD7QTZ4_9ASCO|nr:peptidase C65 Otubain-domain-containing protein [Lipomyces tetrasporus]KAJ8101355.1 peptidase C65 Otubain-domain-containing protein [Lipomyces tetrasporus]
MVEEGKLASDPDHLDDLTILRLTQEIKDVEASKNPLVGDFKPISVLLSEYKDATFRNKIKALGGGNAGYRPVRGDGNCAWRAFAFRYFELLSKLSKEEIEATSNGLQARTSLLDEAGYSDTGYIDFVEETFNLFQKLPDMTPEQVVTEFNNAEVSSAIIVHFRLLAAAYIKTHADDYIPFIDQGEGADIGEYCNRNIEAFSVEADHLALSALVNSMITVDLGVVYMDRSAGDEAVVHKFSPVESSAEGRPPSLKIDLLYRPGHYDIFYK